MANPIIIRLEKHLQCEKLLGLARGTTKKRGNKKSDESMFMDYEMRDTKREKAK